MRRLGDPTFERFKRLCSLVIDGTPLGDYPLDFARTDEERKQFEEMQWLGIALVGCDADLEIGHISYIGRRASMSDFEALTKDGKTIRIELSRVLFGEELQQNKYFEMIAARAQERLETSASTANAGEFIYRVYSETVGSISRKEALQCGDEMADFITTDQRLRAQSTTLYPAEDGSRYPTLTRLEIHVTHSEAAGSPVRVLWDPMIERTDPRAAVALLNEARRDKAEKIDRYSENGKYPVWLVFGAMSIRKHFIALTLVQHLAEREDIDPSPFTRVLVGCYTAGVSFFKAGERPRYTSLTTTG